MDFLIKPLTSFFDLISKGMISITGSNNLAIAYFLAIFIFTAIIKMILLPLTITQTKSAAKMTEMQPKLKEIQEKYKNDPKKLQEKQMELYKETGSNPMAGCLPLLLQFPIFIAMYQMLYRYPGFDKVPFFKLVASKVMAENGGIINGLFYLIIHNPLLFILPIVSGATTYIQGIMMAPKGNDASAKTQKNMNNFMTVFIVYMGFTFPGAMVIYWIVQNVIQILTQYFIINKIKKNEEAKLVK